MKGSPDQSDSQGYTRIQWAFWRRIFAFLIDKFLLELIGLILGFLCFPWLAGIEHWGKGIGLGLALPYFGILNSYLGQGQTLGKRLMKVRVVDRNGKFISLGRSFLRASIITLLAFPFLGMPLSDQPPLFWYEFVQDYLINGLAALTLYLFLFNRRTRQTCHDLIAQSYVPRVENQEMTGNLRPWKGHLLIGLVVAVALAIAWVTGYNSSGRFAQLAETSPLEQRLLNQYPTIRFIDFYPSFYTFNGQVQTRTLRGVIRLKNPPQNLEPMVSDIAATVFAEYPEVEKFDTIGINVYSGFHLGLAQSYQRFPYRYCPVGKSGKLDQRFPPEFTLKTPSFFKLILEDRGSLRPIFVQAPFFSYGNDPGDPMNLFKQPTPFGRCQTPPKPKTSGQTKGENQP